MAHNFKTLEEIQHQHQNVQSNGYIREDVDSLLQGLVKYSFGDVEEEGKVVTDLINNVNDDIWMSELVREYVMQGDFSASTNICYTETMHFRNVIQRLAERKFALVEDNAGVCIHTSDGHEVNQPWLLEGGQRLRERTICSAALKAVMLHTMRTNQEGPPSF